MWDRVPSTYPGSTARPIMRTMAEWYAASAVLVIFVSNLCSWGRVRCEINLAYKQLQGIWALLSGSIQQSCTQDTLQIRHMFQGVCEPARCATMAFGMLLDQKTGSSVSCYRSLRGAKHALSCSKSPATFTLRLDGRTRLLSACSLPPQHRSGSGSPKVMLPITCMHDVSSSRRGVVCTASTIHNRCIIDKISTCAGWRLGA